MDAVAQSFNSGIYIGSLMHRRLSPRLHSFKYKVFMMYLDLDEIDRVLKLSRCWSKRPWSLARFRRADYFGGSDQPLKLAVEAKVAEVLGPREGGRVCVLTNLRYFGYLINPLSVYYCFDKNDTLYALLLEVTNTPWGERHQYVISCEESNGSADSTFKKGMHVSPFNPMNMLYGWQSNYPCNAINISMKNWLEQHCVFEAELNLRRTEISRISLNYVLWQYPWMTAKIFFSIYSQALRLWFKRVPFYKNPHNKNSQ